MTLNYQQVFEKIREIGSAARTRRETLAGLRELAVSRLEAWADKMGELRDKVERARQGDPSLRCALPLSEPLDTAHDPLPPAVSLTLIAADGSQITPDRHAAVYYGLVNVGIIVMRPGSSQVPETYTDSHLLFEDDLYTKTGALAPEALELQRDIAERKNLLEVARHMTGPVVAMTDGPVELWGAKNSSEADYRKTLELHKSILSQLQARDVIVAGYVDKPGADLLVRTLEIAGMSPEQMKEIREMHPLRGVTDLWLFGRLLKAGQRSAVFGLQSSSRAHYTGDLALHFFYLNVGDEKHPSLARVEIPKWVADDDGKLNLLQAALLDQCRVMGAKPYPYILHRAHEIAVVRFEEKEQVEQMLVMELSRMGGEVAEKSAKQSAKDLPGRGRK